MADHFFKQPKSHPWRTPVVGRAVLRCMPSSFVLPRARPPERNVLHPKFAKDCHVLHGFRIAWRTRHEDEPMIECLCGWTFTRSSGAGIILRSVLPFTTIVCLFGYFLSMLDRSVEKKVFMIGSVSGSLLEHPNSWRLFWASSKQKITTPASMASRSRSSKSGTCTPENAESVPEATQEGPPGTNLQSQPDAETWKKEPQLAHCSFFLA